ncbi:MAG: putative NEK protein kinase [Streblomastix strix]|uniref:non-specific serine/threonine protein kinase n=1 Tax=Streblomastix strix TaxID=222440 RepID=A0A5J4U683_9EUKA|nr:MAG: putative NEK protein kinase [Streblomastix strix]
MQQELIRVYLKIQEEKEKLFDEKEQSKKQAEDAQAEIARLREQLTSKETVQKTPKHRFQTKDKNAKIMAEPPKPKQTSTSPISVEYTPLNPSTEDVQISGDTFTHTNDNKNDAVILFDPAISNGVARIEFLNFKQLWGVGIADESVHYKRDDVPLSYSFKAVLFRNNGELKYDGEDIDGNSSFDDNHRVVLDRVWEIFGQMTRSLNHLHSRGIMHRDLKPENIFMNEDGSVRLGDFGLSKDLNEKTYATYAGTKAYMAPEGHLTKKLDLPSDIFSLGIIVFQLLTGQHPFDATSEAKIIDKIEKCEYQKIPNWVSAEMKKLVQQMLSTV